MDIQTIGTSIAAVVAIIGAGRSLYDIISGNKPKLREEYKFARDFLDDIKTKTDMHPFAKEKGYQAIAGTAVIKGNEVAYILTLEDPVRCLRDFVLSRKYIEHLNTTGDLHIVFIKKYKSKWSRNWRKAIYLAEYILFAFGALSPLLLTKPLMLPAKQVFALLTATLPIFGFMAWGGIQSFARIYRGEKLVNNQQKHTKRIVVPESLLRTTDAQTSSFTDFSQHHTRNAAGKELQ